MMRVSCGYYVFKFNAMIFTDMISVVAFLMIKVCTRIVSLLSFLFSSRFAALKSSILSLLVLVRRVAKGLLGS